MDEILNQAPEGLTKEFINEIYEKNKNNITDTLIELWEIPKLKIKEKNRWDEIRDTCDAFDGEMNRLIDNIRKNKIEY